MASTSTLKALLLTERKSLKFDLVEAPLPAPGAHDVLVANTAIAQNPVDWKMALFDFGVTDIPWVLGVDLAGTVLAVGSAVTKFAPGDRVIGFASRKTVRHGAYQSHTVVEEARLAKLPAHYSFEDGATVSLGFVTAAVGLAQVLGVRLTERVAPHGTPLLVWGGASSVGAFAIQLAARAGYAVLTTASAKNADYVKRLGAAHVFDYHDADVVAQIRGAAGDKLALVLDAIAAGSTFEQSIASVTAPSGTVAAALPAPETTGSVKVAFIGSGNAFEQPALHEEVYGVLQTLLDAHELVPNPVKIVPGGLRGVPGGLELGRDNKVSGEKLVYRVADTAWP